MTAFAHQQGGAINLHMAENCALALQRSQTQAVAFGGDVARTLSARHDSSPCADRGMDVVAVASAVRRLTPVECERLQGFPDNYTRIPWRGRPAEQCPDGPRYKALGNSMARPCMLWLGQRIDRVEKLILTLFEPYAPTRANPTVAGVDAAGEG